MSFVAILNPAAQPFLTPTARKGLGQPAFLLTVLPALVAWCLIGFVAARGIDLQLCLTGSGHVLAGIGTSVKAAWAWMNPAQMALEWAVMVAAMMLPTLIPPLSHICARSYRERRLRASLLFVVIFMGIWMGAGVVAALILVPLRAVLGQVGLLGYGAGIGCLIAAAWQLSPAKAWAARRCHMRPALAATGWAADRAVAAYGIRHALRCIASCFMLMVPPMLGPHSLLVMAVIALILLRERAMPRPDFKGTAIVLTLLGAATVL